MARKETPPIRSNNNRRLSPVQRLDAWLKEYRSDYYELLNPGASTSELKAFEKELGVKLPQTFHALYCWRNGQSDQGHSSLTLVFGQTFMPLEQVRSTWKEFNDLKSTDWVMNPVWWNELWVPFLESPVSDHTVVDLRGSFTRKRGQIIEFWHADAERPVIAPSLDEWLLQFVTSLEAGGWKDEDGIFVPPGDQFLSLGGYPKRFNADKPDWYEKQRLVASEKESRRLMGQSRKYCIDAHNDEIRDVIFTPNADALISCSKDIAVWNMKNGRLSHRREIADKGQGLIVDMALTRDGKTLACAYSEDYGPSDLMLWNLPERRLRRSIPVGDYRATSVAFLPDEKYLASAVELSKQVSLWRVDTGKLEWRKQTGFVLRIAVSPDGAFIAATANEGKEITVLDAKTGSKKISLKTESDRGNAYDLAFWTNNFLAVAYAGGVLIWDLKMKQAIWTIEGVTVPICFSPDAQYFLTGSWLTQKGFLRVWDTKSRCEIAQFKGFTFGPGTASFALDSSLLAVSDGKRILVWDFAKAIGES